MPLNTKDYRTFLDPSIVFKLKSLELRAKSVVEGFMVGLHKSPYHGFSVEFSEHRPYMQGDPVKNLDWKVYAKSEKYFVKQFEDETNLIAHVIVDVSGSMDFKHTAEITKFEYAATLAASMIYLMINQHDAVGLTLFAEGIKSYIPPKASRIYLRKLLTELASVNPGGKTNTAENLNKITESVKKRGLIIIFSDFFDDVNKVLTALKKFHYKKNEIIVFQILDPVEINFAFGKDAVFIDKETNEELTTQPFHIQKAYADTMQNFLHTIKSECLRNGIDYNLIETTSSFDKALFNYFKKRRQMF